ncbi:TetR/AcrR family transcriptional regulator [Bacillus sp. EB106-08-02-XG196]|jgi:AcrR family transcriptional regulator|uniref:TetR/AcrR family transcriptional regulator n=1 Tax=Bacillus sp. EB106-08-02-XG196 TaxID=2737049 RepID=UPI0015C435D4|nr:TetR/AcrR family transcriptional regulator [Bacillus sp. EB106-08-02-XG196]NWQ41873.1 TetR/AcrR family transcriptional regulator [Bacillus sp. EB106-08-02-XG196]
MLKPKRMPAEKRKRVIIRAAIEVFSESNYRVAKISEIATRAGVTDPMIYKFFKSKSVLFQEILKKTSSKTLKEFLEQDFFYMEKIVCKEDFRLAVEKSLFSYFASMEKYRKEIKIYFQALSEVDEPDVEKVLKDSYQNYASLYESMLQKGAEANIIQLEMSAKAIAWDIIGFTIHQSTLFLMGFYVEEDAKKLLHQRITMWIP